MSLMHSYAKVGLSSAQAGCLKFRTGAKLLFLILLLSALLMPIYGQKTTGQISGTITDPNGAALPDAAITITEVGTGAQRTARTNADGNYTFADLPIGPYKLVVAHDGFKAANVANLVVNVNTTTRLDIPLEIGAATEQVTITADTIQVETQSGAVGAVISGQQVRELPLNGRSFVKLT